MSTDDTETTNAPPSHLTDRVVVITGAGGGFGRLVAQKAGGRGAKVVASDVDESSVWETASLITDAGGEAEAVTADVADMAQMAAVASRAVERFGAIDVMINNAGVMPLAFYRDHSAAMDAWDRCIDINIKGVLHGIAAVHDQMISQGRGHVVNISSIYGNSPVAGAAVYGATKAAVIYMSESLRQESQGRIKVTTIRPTGVMGTNLGSGVINGEAVSGILGAGGPKFFEDFGAILGDEPPTELVESDSIAYLSLSPDELADQIVYAIDQPWGVSISDLTVRASGDRYMI